MLKWVNNNRPTNCLAMSMDSLDSDMAEVSGTNLKKTMVWSHTQTLKYSRLIYSELFVYIYIYGECTNLEVFEIPKYLITIIFIYIYIL